MLTNVKLADLKKKLGEHYKRNSNKRKRVWKILIEPAGWGGITLSCQFEKLFKCQTKKQKS